MKFIAGRKRVNKASGQPQKVFLNKLVSTINELGIPFSLCGIRKMLMVHKVTLLNAQS
jgi:hypothetical protein